MVLQLAGWWVSVKMCIWVVFRGGDGGARVLLAYSAGICGEGHCLATADGCASLYQALCASGYL